MSVWEVSHSLRGLCGLKSQTGVDAAGLLERHSLRGLCGLKSFMTGTENLGFSSQPARAVWIEIVLTLLSAFSDIVTACEGCVD